MIFKTVRTGLEKRPFGPTPTGAKRPSEPSDQPKFKFECAEFKLKRGKFKIEFGAFNLE